MNARGIAHALLFFVVVSIGRGAEPTPPRSEVLSHIPRQRVESSGICAVGYSKRRHILEVEFSNGAVYRYVDVAPSVYRDLIAAESKARYYDSHIKKNYRSMRVRPRVKEAAAH